MHAHENGAKTPKSSNTKHLGFGTRLYLHKGRYIEFLELNNIQIYGLHPKESSNLEFESYKAPKET